MQKYQFLWLELLPRLQKTTPLFTQVLQDIPRILDSFEQPLLMADFLGTVLDDQSNLTH